MTPAGSSVGSTTSPSTHASSQGTNGSLVVSSSDGICPAGVARHVASTIAQKSSGITRLTNLPIPRTVVGSDTGVLGGGQLCHQLHGEGFG